MTNIIEISVRTTNDTRPGLDQAKADAAEAGAEAGAAFNESYASAVGAASIESAGAAGLGDSAVRAVQEADVGTKMASEIDSQMVTATAASTGWADAWAAKQAKLQQVLEGGIWEAPVIQAPTEPAIEAGATSGDAFVKAFQDETGRSLAMSPVLTTGLGASAVPAGEDFGVKFSAAARDGIDAANIAGVLGTGGEVGEEMVTEATATGAKAGTAMGKATGDSAAKAAESGGDMMKNVLIGAATLAAAVGPAALLAGMGAAVVGVAALVDKSNADIAASYANLGTQAESALDEAITPLTGGIEGAVAILSDGVTQVGPQLKGMFAAAAPYADQIASGLVQFTTNALPGLTAGLKDMQPELAGLAADAGKIGSGLGGFAAGLGTGASGGAAGVQALSSALAEVLPDLGQVIGDLSNGLGPALGDIVSVAGPVAHDLTEVVNAVPPQAIRAAADAVTALFVAFKVLSFGNILADGTTFSGFLKTTLTTAATSAKDAITGVAISVQGLGVAEAQATSEEMASEIEGVGKAATTSAAEVDESSAEMSGSLGGAASTIGLVLVGASMLGEKLNELAGGGDNTATSVDSLVTSLNAAALGFPQAQGAMSQFATTMAVMSNVQGSATEGMGDLDTALTQLYASNPAEAATEFKTVSSAMEAQGDSASKVAALLPQYSKAVSDTAVAAKLAAPASYDLVAAITAAGTAATTSARNAGATAVAALNLGSNQTKLSGILAASVTSYQMAQAGASGYNSVLTALNGAAVTAADAQNTMDQDILNAATAFKANGESLAQNTQAGIDNREAVSAAAKAAVAMGVANYATSGSIATANGVIQQQVNAFVKATGATGQAKAAIEQYISTMDKLPSNITTTVNANINPGLDAVNSLVRTIDNTQAYVQVNAATGHITIPGHAYGGVVSAAATGGSRGGLTQMDEQGIELVDLPNGSRVTPASNVASLAASGALGGGSGYGGPVQLEWVGGSADALFQLIKSHVKLVGGRGPDSVQRALGVS